MQTVMSGIQTVRRLRQNCMSNRLHPTSVVLITVQPKWGCGSQHASLLLRVLRHSPFRILEKVRIRKVDWTIFIYFLPRNLKVNLIKIFPHWCLRAKYNNSHALNRETEAWRSSGISYNHVISWRFYSGNTRG